jgi:hypothetical protein
MGDMVVPLSMALLTVYDEKYLGTDSDEDEAEAPGNPGKSDAAAAKK